MKCYGLPRNHSYYLSKRYYGGHRKPSSWRILTRYLRHRARMTAKAELRAALMSIEYPGATCDESRRYQ